MAEAVVRTTLSPLAGEFIPSTKTTKPKKSKSERAAPRRRRRKDKNSKDTLSDDEYDENPTDQKLKRNNEKDKSSKNPKSQSEAWVDWLHGMVGDIISSDKRAKSSHRNRGLSSELNSEEWLALQTEWLISKHVIGESEYAKEAAERKKWGEWATHASEMERKRRILLMESIDAAEKKERQIRRLWAIEAIEQEKRERISAQFLSSVSSTQWFSEAISAYHEDYELVCPYYKYGCIVHLKRSNVKAHLKKCRYALEIGTLMNSELNTVNYEVVCPNSVLGCTYIGGDRSDIYHHLDVCTYRGKTKDEELEERRQLRQHVSQIVLYDTTAYCYMLNSKFMQNIDSNYIYICIYLCI
jgi:hypothetical protein